MAIKIVFYLGLYSSRWCVKVFFTDTSITKAMRDIKNYSMLGRTMMSQHAATKEEKFIKLVQMYRFTSNSKESFPCKCRRAIIYYFKDFISRVLC